MVNQTRLGIIAILLVIPMISYTLLTSDTPPPSADITDSRVQILASFYPIAEFAKNVGQQHVKVSLLVPQGIEPHDWEPSISEIQTIKQAQLIIINGAGFEQWIDDIALINPSAQILDTSYGIDTIPKHEASHQSEQNPHIWLDPIFAQKQVQNIADALGLFDDINKQNYDKNAKTFINQLSLLDSKIKTELSTCDKDFISFHDAFIYFSARYGLTQHYIVASDPHAIVTPKDLQDTINLAKSLNISIIFTQKTDKASGVIAKEIGGSVLELNSLEIINDNSTYIQKMEDNLNNLKVALC